MLIFDINHALEQESNTVIRYDLFRFTACLQGILNRRTPELFLTWEAHDTFWLEYMTSPGKFLHDVKQEREDTFDGLLSRYAQTIRENGLILWDEAVPSTLNAATTACGVDGVLPVRGGSEALRRILDLTNAPVHLDLCGKFTGEGTVWQTGERSTGSAKCDAYLWALNTYMSRCSDHLLFFTLDGIRWNSTEPVYPDFGNAFVPNMDYAVKNRAFVFDLFSFDDEAPSDDPHQPIGTDLAMMKRILLAQYEKTAGEAITTVCGFNPWHLKYTTHGNRNHHEPVEAEWRFGEIISAYNCVKDADAAGYCGLANASLYSQYPLKEQYHNRQPKGTGEGYNPKKTYILFYVGDYDSAAWTARFIPRWAKDPALGKNPLMWCFNPNLSDRIPMAFDYIYEHFTDNDYFQAGDSGAGYNNPRLLYEPRIFSDLPDAGEANVRHNLKYFRKFDQSVIGFVINGVHRTDERQMKDLARFATTGVGYNGYGEEAKIVDGVPFMTHTADIAAEHNTGDEGAQNALFHMAHTHEKKRFHILRTILISPTEHDQILQKLRELAPEKNIELLDPYTFFEYLKIAIENGEMLWYNR